MGRYQKGKTNPDFTEARDSEWQWHQLGRMQVCTLLQTDNHASTPPLSFFTSRMPFLSPNQQRQSTEGQRPNTKTSCLITERQQLSILDYCVLRWPRAQRKASVWCPSVRRSVCPSLFSKVNGAAAANALVGYYAGTAVGKTQPAASVRVDPTVRGTTHTKRQWKQHY